ncbi:UNVERIFIED_CONTAM: tRNA N(3)-methylcytidine methyltransferase METTL6 [Sesamum angustifolium]|uniref:tRNA N(3)-methylcytidine methyltransferase METTL6 n=1 Tax=Sesamum angustifolium TaxID=2727405 RepID=A0AAW2MIU7_9LAMI
MRFNVLSFSSSSRIVIIGQRMGTPLLWRRKRVILEGGGLIYPSMSLVLVRNTLAFQFNALKVGCGAGNTIFPLLATYPDIFVHACDFSPRAVNLVKLHKDFIEARVNAFVCDLTIDDLCLHVAPSSVDIVTMERFTGKEQKISENFYVRGDGTRAFYFSNEFLRNIFKENGFKWKNMSCVASKWKIDQKRSRWVQAVFRRADTDSSSGASTGNEPTHLQGDCDKRKDDINGFEIDIPREWLLKCWYFIFQ